MVGTEAQEDRKSKKNKEKPLNLKGIVTSLDIFLELFLAEPLDLIGCKINELEIHLIENNTFSLNLIGDRIDASFKHKVGAGFCQRV